VMMPVYLMLTFLALYRLGEKSIRPYAIAAAGFTWPLIVLMWWFVTNPSQYGQQIRMYHLYDSSRFGPLQGLKELMNYTSLTARTGVYYDYFNPSFLFFSGDSSLINATRSAGVFTFSIAVLLPLGIYRLFKLGLTPIRLTVILGLVSAPLAATIVGEPHRINRALVMLPFAALLATYGFEHLWSARNRLGRIAAIVLLLAVALQFRGFYRDYVSDYRVRSSTWFEGNIRGGLEKLIALSPRDQQRPVYISTEIPWVNFYWRFYLVKYDRRDLLVRTVYFDPKDPHDAAVPIPALTMSVWHEGPAEGCVPITEPNGVPSFLVCEHR
jgi:hypothetical protein